MKQQVSTRRGTGFQPVRRKIARPTRKLLRWAVRWGLAPMMLMGIANCRETVIAPNLIAGVRDGLVTTTSGIIQDAFNSLFGLSGDEEEEGGNDLFVGI